MAGYNGNGNDDGNSGTNSGYNTGIFSSGTPLPIISGCSVTNGVFSATVNLPPNLPVTTVVQATTDLANGPWTNIATNNNNGQASSYIFTDDSPADPNQPQKFYRVAIPKDLNLQNTNLVALNDYYPPSPSATPPASPVVSGGYNAENLGSNGNYYSKFNNILGTNSLRFGWFPVQGGWDENGHNWVILGYLLSTYNLNSNNPSQTDAGTNWSAVVPNLGSGITNYTVVQAYGYDANSTNNPPTIIYSPPSTPPVPSFISAPYTPPSGTNNPGGKGTGK